MIASSSGAAAVNMQKRTLSLHSGGSRRQLDTLRLPQSNCGILVGHAREAKDFARTVRDNWNAAMPLHNAVGSVAVADAITASVEFGQIGPVETPSI